VPLAPTAQGKLMTQIALPTVIGLVQLGDAIVQTAVSPVEPATALWLVVPFAVGFGLESAIRVAWDDQAAQVILVGNQLILTLGFVIVNLGSQTMLEHFLSDGLTTGLNALLVASGLLLGHSVGLMHRVHGALQH
jgi:hypothetical protein